MLHAGQVGVDEISRVLAVQRFPVSIQLPLRILVAHAHIAHEELVRRQNLGQDFEERQEVDDAHHRLLSYALLQGIDVRHEHVVIVVESSAVDDRTDDVRDGLWEVLGDVEWLAAVLVDLAEEEPRLLVQLRLKAHSAHSEVSQTAHREAAVFSPNLALRKHNACNNGKRHMYLTSNAI